MKPLLPFFKWLAIAALADWLITRTVTRSAIFMPKTAAMITIYEGLNTAGLFATTLCSLLVLVVLGWMSWQHWQSTKQATLPLLWTSLLVLSLAFLFVLPTGGLVLGYYILVLLTLLAIGRQIYRSRSNLHGKFVGMLPVLALAVGAAYQLVPALYDILGWHGPPVVSEPLFNLGEFIVVLCPVGWWWIYGRGASWKTWVVGSLPALVFTVMRLATPAMTGTIAIWSIGLTLYLPWPLYVGGLWLLAVTVIVLLRRRDPSGWALLLLAASGYAPQLSTPVLAGLVALWLLTWRMDDGTTVRDLNRRAILLKPSHLVG